MANLLTPEWDRNWPGLRGARLGAPAGAEALGASVYEIDPGGELGPLTFTTPMRS